MTSLFPTHVVF
jgi:PAS domain-containing protein